jgi:ubiquinone/menaquinone biosynthesis C-methylase UbiE
MAKTVKNLNSKIYYQGQYWNDLPQIQNYISKKITGDENKSWIENFKEKYASIPFQHGLFLNCGDGRWEREFIDRKIVRTVTAFDVSPNFIKKAKMLKGQRKIEYILADANKINLPKEKYDLIVNYAALHHTQYINRLCYKLAKSLTKNGIFLNFDYVGPSRNQYPILNWLIVNYVNCTLPKNLKKPNLGYPHLPTMLVTDPTEAIHSDLIVNSVARYFKIVEKHDVGGGIAYELLTHNTSLNQKTLSSRNSKKHIDRLVKLDAILTKLKVVPVFFSYFIASRKTLKRIKNMYFQEVENVREECSVKLENIYTLFNFIVMLKHYAHWKRRVKMITKYTALTLARTYELVLISIKYI